MSTWSITPHDLVFIIPPPHARSCPIGFTFAGVSSLGNVVSPSWRRFLLCWFFVWVNIRVWLRRTIWANGWFVIYFQFLRKWIRRCLLFVLCRELRGAWGCAIKIVVSVRSIVQTASFAKRVSRSPVGIENFWDRGSPAIWRTSSLLRIGLGNFATGSECRYRRSKNWQICSQPWVH